MALDDSLDQSTADWALKVEGLGRVYGHAGPESLTGTGPGHGTSVSPVPGAVVAAWDVSFAVAPGEALGIVGESGSGKSTVMRCVAGDERPTAGAAYLRGVGAGCTNVFALADGERRRLRIDQI